jgi:hypothetical protein
MTCALLVQGVWHDVWMHRWSDYDNQFDEIVISTYKQHMDQIMCHEQLVNNHKVKIVLNDTSFPPGVDWYGNIWHQCKTTLSGLQITKSDHVIKCRTDEFWSNLHELRAQVESDPRFHSINIYFKKWNVFPLHVGDHLFGGHTQDLKQGFQLLEQLLRVDHFGNKARAAEQKICAALIMSKGESPNWSDCRRQLKKYWQVFDAQRLEPFRFNAPSVGTQGTTVCQVAACESRNPTVCFYDHVDKYCEP